MLEANKIPEGFVQDSQGRLVPVATIKEIDKLRNELVLNLVQKARAVSAVLAEFKAFGFSEIEGFCELSAQEYDKSLGGVKGNVVLTSFDGRYRVTRAKSDLLGFDERLKIAKALIDECLQEWSSNARSEIQLLVNDVFQVDRQGNVNIQRILSLRKFEIKDARWQQAMTAIGDSLTVAGSRTYLRIYERVGTTDQWRQIPLDMASV